MITATRFHDFCAGHRVHGHESKCAHLHGHNYRVHFTVAPRNFKLDSVGRVLDFSDINRALCQWVEHEWDHKMLLWENDPLCKVIKKYDSAGVVVVPFNPTAENMARHLLLIVGPAELPSNIELLRVHIEETRKCAATATKGDDYEPTYTD